MAKVRLLVTVDPGDSPDFQKIVAEVDRDDFHEAIAQIMRGGVHDRSNGIWYPPQQVRKVEYEPPTP